MLVATGDSGCASLVHDPCGNVWLAFADLAFVGVSTLHSPEVNFIMRNLLCFFSHLTPPGLRFLLTDVLIPPIFTASKIFCQMF